MDWVTWINTGVGIIGIVVGIIGAKNISYAKKIINKNKIKADHGSTVYNAETINQGIGDRTARLIAKDMTHEEMCKLIIRLIPVNTDDENCAANRLRRGTVTADQFNELLEEIPTHYYGSKKPPKFPNMKDGSTWHQI
ncbi:MAG: hypothetical protein J6J78_00350 [Clostridia bacterium]|nr:hypothetical protein [Clostridia bacterium]